MGCNNITPAERRRYQIRNNDQANVLLAHIEFSEGSTNLNIILIIKENNIAIEVIYGSSVFPYKWDCAIIEQNVLRPERSLFLRRFMTLTNVQLNAANFNDEQFVTARFDSPEIKFNELAPKFSVITVPRIIKTFRQPLPDIPLSESVVLANQEPILADFGMPEYQGQYMKSYMDEFYKYGKTQSSLAIVDLPLSCYSLGINSYRQGLDIMYAFRKYAQKVSKTTLKNLLFITENYKQACQLAQAAKYFLDDTQNFPLEEKTQIQRLNSIISKDEIHIDNKNKIIDIMSSNSESLDVSLGFEVQNVEEQKNNIVDHKLEFQKDNLHKSLEQNQPIQRHESVLIEEEKQQAIPQNFEQDVIQDINLQKLQTKQQGIKHQINRQYQVTPLNVGNTFEGRNYLLIQLISTYQLI